MFNPHLNLARKTALIVAIPLVCTMAFLLAVGFLLMNSDRDLARMEQAQDILRLSDKLNNDMLRASLTVSMYNSIGRLELLDQYEAILASMTSTASQLEAATSSDREQSALARACSEDVKATAACLSGMRGLWQEETAVLKQFRLRDDFARLERTLLKGTQDSTKLAQLGARRAQTSREESQRTRSIIFGILIASAVMSFVIAFGMAHTMSKTINSRLSALAEKARLVAANQALEANLDVDDEIGQLAKALRRMEIELKEASRRERAVVENAAEVICSLDEDGKISQVNPACWDLWGYDPEDLLGRRLTSLIHPDYIDTTSGAIERARCESAKSNLETAIVHKNGGTVDLHLSCSAGQSSKSVFCVAHDISERKRLERMRSDFVNMITHDLRTPLASLRAALQLIQKGTYGELSERGNERLAAADLNVTRLINMLNDLLVIEKLESGGTDIVCAEVNFPDVARQARDLVKDLAEQRQITIDVEVCPVAVWCDEDRMVQVVANLFGNAIKFSPDGGTIRLHYSESSATDAELEVRISDEGPGVPPGEQGRIFDRFQMISKQRSQNKAGAGLGLAICKSIVEQHGGKIGVFNNEGAGCTFWFKVPRESGKALESDTVRLAIL